MLVNGSFRNAVAACQSGLRLLRSRVSTLPEEQNDVDGSFSTFKCGLVSVRTTEIDCDTDPLKTYDKAIRILQLNQDSSFYTPEQESLTSVVLLYNMALAFHLMHTHHRKALQLYEMALQLLENFPHDEANVLFFSMAVINNMGNIYSSFMDWENTDKCMDSLKYFLEKFYQCCDGSYSEETIYFLLNTIAVDGPYKKCAPAA